MARRKVPRGQAVPVSHLHNHPLGPEDFPGGSDGKESACNAGDLGSGPGSEDPLEKGMATHSGILAWRSPRTEEPGGPQSTGSQELDTTERLTPTACGSVRQLHCRKAVRHYKKKFPDFPGDPVVKKPHFHCRGHVCFDEENLGVQ